MAKQAILFSEGPAEEVPPVVYAKVTKHAISLKKRHSKNGLLMTQSKAAYTLGSGEPYGILCRRYEGWYIKAIMAFIKQSGINAIYEKMHVKGLGFTGYLIKPKKL